MLIVDFNVENICIRQTDRQTDRHSWEWKQLVCLEDSLAAKPTKGNEEARRAAALRLVRCGELSRPSL